MRLANKVALITGASTGLGASMAQTFAQEGAHVVINYPNEDESHNAQTLREELLKTGQRALAYQADVSDWTQVEKMVASTLKEFNRLDILVNNAGLNSYKSIEEIDLETWNRTIAVTLTGTFMCTRLALPPMKEQGSGNIVNIASVAPWLGRGTIDYNAAKSGVLAITRSIARQYGPNGIRCNTIAPSVHKTPMAEKVMASDEGIDYIDSIPLGFVPGPESVAKAALFLASEDSYYISGHTLLVDGGLTLR